MSKPLVSIIIVNWNGGELFRDCIDSLKKNNYSNWELIVVDNASADNSLKFLKDIKNLKVIRNKLNVGFAPANNQGYEVSKGEYILLLNNDTKVERDFLNKLIERIEKDDTVGVIQPKVRLLLKPKHLDAVGSYLTRTGFLEHVGFLEKDKGQYDGEEYIFSAKGACMLIRRELVERLGLFDNDYGSYFEETDFCWRVWLAGSKILYYPNSVIYHRVGFTSKRQAQTFVNYHSFKNRLATLIKNLSLVNLLLICGVHVLLLTALAFYYLLTLRFENFLMVTKALSWNLVNLPRTLNKRKKTQILRKLSDSEIFPYILKSFDWHGMFRHFMRSEKMLSGRHEV